MVVSMCFDCIPQSSISVREIVQLQIGRGVDAA